MTVLVGIKCTDGIVIGADSSVSFSIGQHRTIEQSGRKIEILESCMIVAVTGQMGLGQRFCHQLTEAHKAKKFSGMTGVDFGRTMAQIAVQDFAQTSAPQGQFGALVAFPARHELHLCEFAATDMQPELKTASLWYASMGNGQLIADPFLGLMRKVFWKTGMPNTSDGVFAAAWTLQHTIDVNAGGVNGPMHLAILSMEGGKPVARMLDEAEVAQHQESVAGAEKYLTAYRDVLQGKDAATVPDIPTPPLQAA